MIKVFRFKVILLFLFVLCGCEPAPERDFTDADLLVDQSVFPTEDWTLIKQSDSLSDSEGQISGAYVIMDSTRLTTIARAGETIYRYESVNLAAYKYDRFKSYFDKSARSEPIPTPEEFAFSSEVPDQWQFGCTIDHFQPTSDFANSETICSIWHNMRSSWFFYHYD